MSMVDNEEKLVKMLEYVSQHNDFYKKRIKEYGISNPLDITQWPILTQDDLKNITPTNIIMDMPEKILYSSGSTGLAKKVIWKNRDYISMCLNAWKFRKKWYHINPSMKTLHFYGSALYNDNVDFQQIESDYYCSNNELFINYRCLYNKVHFVKKLINDFLPEIVFSFPSMFMFLLENSTSDDVWRKNIRYIELYGENVTREQTTEIHEKIPDAQFAVMYGTTETGAVALTCPDLHMHVVEKNCFVECIDDHLVLTSLVNTQMPFIRYFIDDIGSTRHFACSCGIASNTIVDLKGRKPGVILTSGGKVISAAVIPECVNMVNAEYHFSIISYYVEQLVVGELNVYISLSSYFLAWKDTIIAKLKSCLSSMIVDLDVIHVFTEIPLTSKKRNYYVCRCNEYGKG